MHHRYVLGLPMVSVETLGAGGGSLCHVREETLEVGPESAGADPGPVCYGRGGTRPTVTDANLVLGLLSDASDFAGGSFRLTRKGVEEAFREHVADPLGCSVEEAAFDCWRVVNANMTQAVRRWTAEKGTDPRELVMLAYGGNGPVFAGVQAEDLGISRVLVPKSSPTFSALGALAARPTIDEERSYLVPVASADLDRLRALWEDLDARAEGWFEAAGFARAELVSRYALNLRYPGQNWSLTIDVAERRGARDLGFVDARLAERVAGAFHERHREEYGHDRLAETPEITGVRLETSVETPQPRFGHGRSAPAREPAPAGHRLANLGRGFEETAVFHGPDLRPGDRIAAPAIVEETFTTIVVYPGWQAVVDDAGDYVLER
jgi:N-methylhydantoinase A